MKRVLFLVPVSSAAGLTTVSLGLLHAFDKRGVRAGFFKPIAQDGARGPERSTHFVRATSGLTPAAAISISDAERMMAQSNSDELLSTVMNRFHESAANADVMVVEGLVATANDPFIGPLNAELIQTLGAEVIFVGDAASLADRVLHEHLDFAARLYVKGDRRRIAGCILNRLRLRKDESPDDAVTRTRREYGAFRPELPELVGLIPHNDSLMQCRTRDIARHLNADVLSSGDIDQRRVKAIHLLARTVPNMMHTFRAGNILVVPADRDDVVVAASMAAVKGVPLAGLVLTGDTSLDGSIFTLCSPGLATGLPVLRVKTNSYETARQLHAMSTAVPSDDLQRIQSAMEFVSEHIEGGWIDACCRRSGERRMSPAAFCHQLTEQARAVNRKIVLPEGTEPRTIRAAVICAERGIARSILLGDPDEIRQAAEAQEIKLPRGVEIVDANAVRANYVESLMHLRRHKQLSRQAAEEMLEDNVVLGTMMLALDEVDGLVSGAQHSSANTVRPALQLIKTKPGVHSVSSIFFMCLPEQVVVYGDCAIIQDPDARTLAEIAIQSAESARQFGIPPRVAMISYSTGTSGSGIQVEKVCEATRLARDLRPDLLLDGPLQYDAAANREVAAKKAPESAVAGRATVFVFPDLNTGNTTYKAVQRSANVVSIGPMLQGLRKPVNDLSRGALVEDIVYTIALTAVQAASGGNE